MSAEFEALSFTEFINRRDLLKKAGLGFLKVSQAKRLRKNYFNLFNMSNSYIRLKGKMSVPFFIIGQPTDEKVAYVFNRKPSKKIIELLSVFNNPNLGIRINSNTWESWSLIEEGIAYQGKSSFYFFVATLENVKTDTPASKEFK